MKRPYFFETTKKNGLFQTTKKKWSFQVPDSYVGPTHDLQSIYSITTLPRSETLKRSQTEGAAWQVKASIDDIDVFEACP